MLRQWWKKNDWNLCSSNQKIDDWREIGRQKAVDRKLGKEKAWWIERLVNKW